MRYGAICKALHVLPRSGGVLEQDAREMMYLEAILDAFGRYEEYRMNKNSARDKNRQRHAETREILEDAT